MSWLAAAAAVLLLVSLWLDLSMVPGPWLLVAFSSGVAALLATVATLVLLHAVARHIEAADARAAIAESERQMAQREVERLGRVEGELIKAKQAAESAVLAKGEFLATMSHEIRTPLNGIVPMLELLSRSALAPDQRQLLLTATASSQTLLRIVDDILDYSKLEANKLELENTAFNLREVLEQVMQLMQRPAESRGLRLGLQLDPTVRLSVRGDPLRLRQVLTNLIGNAIKFTERGSVTLVARRLGETGAQHLLRFEVRDTGIGIDPEAQARLFSPFSQADASTTRIFGGTGLGLAICKRIVGLMGGRIAVVSELGRGSTFWFEIPLLKALGDLPAPARPAQARVLLVSADGRLRSRLSNLVPQWNASLQCVETVQEALERLRANTAGFHTVVADLSPSMRSSARALHRVIGRLAQETGTQLVWLYGDEPVPEELRVGATSLPRLAHESDLRALLSTIPKPPTAPASAPVHVEQPLPLPEPEPFAGAGPAADASQPIAVDGRRVLLVEDNPVNLAVAEKMLESLGFRADHAHNGVMALEKMERTRYPLVLMDCQMPLLDGYTATRRWREREAERGQPRLPIVAMTANAMAGDRQRCLDAGMDDYLSKPVSRALLEECLVRWLPPVGEASDSDTPSSEPSAGALPAVPVSEGNPVSAAPPSPAPPPSAPALGIPVALDTALLDELVEFTGPDTSRIIQVFLEDAPRLIAELEAASAAPDLEAMRAAAHSLKSSSANLGALALSAAAKRIELGAREARLERPAVAVALVIAEFARARVALQDYLARLEGAPAAAQSSSLVNR
ncbi:sensor histidine kinase [Pseudoxanthomonas winnipegensis]|jgi:signal transduction histidine kinase/CheY-like chemotaxis protein|uniref:histidine kinase n=1 Tax=Pseudoxanthomonas winnipegensis TaxID=2480810 RepID=A0ABY1WEA8_9GAMM|nr:hybrid sensor histidine kinase/response regulator [Pseudoxanthomonas winnipegensis]TAA11926.1 sensor histidine kinase [Pseudoxanthomonas winnipegensis]TAA19710.1 sensor histidine kinase [Pseudoxanthomonas winnipegensis]TAH70783.1 sensor histidine kinase [Pseudoxanthomonas winnipegensis]